VNPDRHTSQHQSEYAEPLRLSVDKYCHLDNDTVQIMMEMQAERVRLTEEQIEKEAHVLNVRGSINFKGSQSGKVLRPSMLPIPLNSPEVGDDSTPSVFLHRDPEYSYSIEDSSSHIARPVKSRRLNPSVAPYNSPGVASNCDSAITHYDFNSGMWATHDDEQTSEICDSASELSESREYSTGSMESQEELTSQPVSRSRSEESTTSPVHEKEPMLDILPLWENLVILNPTNTDTDYNNYDDIFNFPPNLVMLEKWKIYEEQHGFDKLVEDINAPKDSDDRETDLAFRHALRDKLRKMKKEDVSHSKDKRMVLDNKRFERHGFDASGNTSIKVNFENATGIDDEIGGSRLLELPTGYRQKKRKRQPTQSKSPKELPDADSTPI